VAGRLGQPSFSHIFTTLYVLIVGVHMCPCSASQNLGRDIPATPSPSPPSSPPISRSAPRPPRPRCPHPRLPPGCLPCLVHGPRPIPRPVRVTPLLPQRVRALPRPAQHRRPPRVLAAPLIAMPKSKQELRYRRQSAVPCRVRPAPLRPLSRPRVCRALSESPQSSL
jgi:hypothetical protein